MKTKILYLRNTIINFFKRKKNIANENKNTYIGMSYRNRNMIVHVCKHGADWHHPNCDDIEFWEKP